MRLIHCSDLHLDSKMESNLSPRQARERSGEICATFVRMVRWAQEHEVRGVLLAGDLFDTGRVQKKTADLVLDTMARAAELDFYYLRGNHDDGRDPFAGRTLPENLHTFGPRWTGYDLDGVAITGLELDRENCTNCYDDLTLDREKTNIVLLHGQTAPQPGEDQVCLPRLRGRGIDYLALGHIHSFRLEDLDDRGQWCYCGCLEGRGFDECGEKGFALLDIHDGRVAVDFVPFAARQICQASVDITHSTTITQIHQAMEEASADFEDGSMVKFTLTGSYTPETQKDLTTLTELMSQRFWFVRIKDESWFRLDRAAYEHDASLKGQFIRLVMASDRAEDVKARIICAGLQALAGEAVEV